MFDDIFEFRLELAELDIIGCLYAQDGTTEHQQLAYYGYGGAGNLSQRRDEEKAHAGNNHPTAETHYGDGSLQAGKLYFLPL